MVTLKPKTERELMAEIKRAAQELGFLAYHNLYSVGSDPGFPDLTISGPIDWPTATMFYEVKGPRGKPTDRQLLWLATLHAQGFIARLVREENVGDVYDDLATAYARALERRQRG